MSAQLDRRNKEGDVLHVVLMIVVKDAKMGFLTIFRVVSSDCSKCD